MLKKYLFVEKKLNSGKEYDKFEISKAVAISAIFVNIWPLIPSGNFFNNWLSMFYFFIQLAFIYILNSKMKKK